MVNDRMLRMCKKTLCMRFGPRYNTTHVAIYVLPMVIAYHSINQSMVYLLTQHNLS